MSKTLPKINLLYVYEDTKHQSFEWTILKLYEMLGERKPEENISHKKMPMFDKHREFVKSMPYHEWYLVQNDRAQIVGNTYITYQSEIGIFIKEQHRRKGYASAVLSWILETYPEDTFFANINPNNEKSHLFFKSYGFYHVQNTLRRDPTE